MPTNRRFRKTQSRGAVTESQWAYLLDDREKSWELDPWEEFMLGAPYGEYSALRRLWDEYRNAVLDVWVREFPGTRPNTWWMFDAPRIPVGTFPGCFWEGKLSEPRRKVSGSGVAAWDAGLNILPSFELGIPTSMVEFEEEDPPVFESQATYLDRHDLLPPVEKRRLRAQHFEPEIVRSDSGYLEKRKRRVHANATIDEAKV